MEQANKANRDMIAREQEIERMREKAGHDEAQALYNASKKGFARGYVRGFAKTRARLEAIKAIATNMLKMNLSMDTIVTATGITNEEWKQLNSNLEMLSDESNEEQEKETEKEKGAPVMEQANKADRDEAQELYHAIAEGRAIGKAEGIMTTVKNMLKMDLPMDMIVTATGLTHEEIEQLKPMDKTMDN